MSVAKTIAGLAIVAGLTLFFGISAALSLVWNIIVKGPRQVLYVKKREKRPEVLDDPELGTHHFARLKSIRLHYVAKGPEDRPLMLFIHGFPEFWYSWRHQIKEFGNDYRVVAFDMRGYSESEKPPGVSSYAMTKLVADVEEFIQYLGYKKCIVVSHDWGGAVAWAFATKHPDMVEKLIICNSPHSKAFQKLISKSLIQLKKSWYMFVFQWPLLPILLLRSEDMQFLVSAFTGKMGCRPGMITADDIEAFKYTFQHWNDMACPVNYYRAIARYPPKDPRFKARVTVPTMTIWGTNDLALSKELAEMAADYVDDYKVAFIEGASHWVQQDYPQETNKHIRAFLDSKAGE